MCKYIGISFSNFLTKLPAKSSASYSVWENTGIFISCSISVNNLNWLLSGYGVSLLFALYSGSISRLNVFLLLSSTTAKCVIFWLSINGSNVLKNIYIPFVYSPSGDFINFVYANSFCSSVFANSKSLAVA